MDPTRQLDFYCERLGGGLWAEPLNAFSNLAFFFAAYLLWRRYGREVRPWAILIAMVGLGSLAFHVFATVWAHWLDLLFIEIFIYSFIAAYLRRVFAFDWIKVFAGFLVYFFFEKALTAAFEPGAMNDSYRYLPALALLTLMASAAPRVSPAMLRPLWAATLIFVFAIALRTMDFAVCSHWSSGTHFIWHMFNAAVLYCAVLALRRQEL